MRVITDKSTVEGITVGSWVSFNIGRGQSYGQVERIGPGYLKVKGQKKKIRCGFQLLTKEKYIEHQSNTRI